MLTLQSSIELLRYPIKDIPTFPASRYFDIIADRIDANVASSRRTLLYCHHDRSRSVTFISACLIKHHHLSLPEAFSLVRTKRPLTLLNADFLDTIKII